MCVQELGTPITNIHQASVGPLLKLSDMWRMRVATYMIGLARSLCTPFGSD